MTQEAVPSNKGAAMTKRSEIVNVPYVDEGDEAIALDRRKFFKGVGIAVLTVQILPLITCASGNSPSGGSESADNLIVHSGPGFMSHVHDLLVPYAVLKAPPLQGVALRTSEAMLHTHNVGLTKEQLMIVNQGGTVTKKASSHLFVIKLQPLMPGTGTA
jgi:hypothetical protein